MSTCYLPYNATPTTAPISIPTSRSSKNSNPTKSRAMQSKKASSQLQIIDDYIYMKDRYRFTSLEFPFPGPMVRTRPQPETLTRWNAAQPHLLTAIRKSLDGHAVYPFSIELFDHSKPGYPNGGSKLVPALYIDVDTSDFINHCDSTNPRTRKWSAALNDLITLLHSHGFPDIGVEIQDPERLYIPSLFPILPAHPAVAGYEAVRETIRIKVMERISDCWEMISLYRVGRTTDSANVRIMVMVSPLAEHDWANLVSELEEIANKDQPLQERFQIEVMPGRCGRFGGEEEEVVASWPGESFKDDLATHPRIGSSIGVAGKVGAGMWFRISIFPISPPRPF